MVLYSRHDMKQNIIEYIQRNLAAGSTKEDIVQALRDAGHHERDIDEAMKRAADQHASGELERFSVWMKIWLALSNPTKLFEHTKHEGIRPALILCLLLAIISSISFLTGYGLQTLIELLNVEEGERAMFSLFMGGIGLLFVPFYYVISVGGSFLMAAIFHLSAMIFKGKGGYADSYKAVVYSSVPSTLLGVIPFIGWIGSIWSLVLIILAISAYHSVSAKRALAIWGTPVLVLIGIVGICIGLIIGVILLL